MNLDIEMSKRLKDAGFPQTIKDTQDTGALECGHCGYYMKGDVHRPTLEELIDACGRDLGMLINESSGWIARPCMGEDGLGKTPSEAVANLFLVLNEQ